MSSMCVLVKGTPPKMMINVLRHLTPNRSILSAKIRLSATRANSKSAPDQSSV